MEQNEPHRCEPSNGGLCVGQHLTKPRQQLQQPPIGQAKAVHNIWQVDAKENLVLLDGSPGCYLTITDEHSGAGLAALVFPRPDFYGLCKSWPIIFVIFFSPANDCANPVNQPHGRPRCCEPHSTPTASAFRFDPLYDSKKSRVT